MKLTIDTSKVPPRDQFSFWADSATKYLHPVVVTRDGPGAYNGNMTGVRLGDIDLFRIRGDSLTVMRTAKRIRERDPERLQVTLPLQGTLAVQQADRSALAGPGDISSQSTSQPYAVFNDTGYDLLLFELPQAELGRDAAEVLAATAMSIPGGSAMGRLAGPLFRNIYSGLASGMLDGSDDGLVDCVSSLTRSLFRRQTEDVLTGKSAALFPAILKYIDAHLGQPGLSPRSIAAAHFISVRYLHKMFADHEMTVAGMVRARRLEACVCDLTDPALGARSIASIAARRGFTNAAHFSNAFKQYTGTSPRRYRLEHLALAKN